MQHPSKENGCCILQLSALHLPAGRSAAVPWRLHHPFSYFCLWMRWNSFLKVFRNSHGVLNCVSCQTTPALLRGRTNKRRCWQRSVAEQPVGAELAVLSGADHGLGRTLPASGNGDLGRRGGIGSVCNGVGSFGIPSINPERVVVKKYGRSHCLKWKTVRNNYFWGR